MRIVLANKFLYPKGGAERAVLDVGAELVRRGHDVSYFGMQHPRNTVLDAETVRNRDYHRRGPAAWRDAAAMIWSFEAERRFASLVRRRRPEVMHCHNIYHQLTPSILAAARAQGVAVVLTAHDYKLVCPRYDMLRHGRPCDTCVDDGPTACLRHRCAGGSWARSLLLAAESAFHRSRRSYDAVDAFIAPSRFLRTILVRAGFDAERVRLVRNFATAPAPTAVTPVPGRFVYAGRLSAEKGVATVIAAATRLRAGTLVICGDGPEHERVAAAAAAAPAGRVVLRGHLSAADLHAELAAAAFAVVPSQWFENAPFAVLEAMAAGRGVVASRIGGLPELVADGETGVLVAPGDVEAWTQVLATAVAAPAVTAAWGRAARARALRDHDLGAHVDRLEALYREVVS